MPKFITIGYGDRDGYDRTDAAVRDAAHAHDAQLRDAGILMGSANGYSAARKIKVPTRVTGNPSAVWRFPS